MFKKNFFLSLWLAAALSSTSVASGVEEVRLGDVQGDWGLPTPYQHYPRGPGYIRMSWIFDTLVWKNDKGTIPALAQSWSVNPETKTYTFHLNPKAMWHDGKPVSANDVVFTFEYVKKHPYAWACVKAVQSVHATDEKTVEITLEKPFAPFFDTVAGTLPILPQHIWKNVTDPKTFLSSEACIGSGPFRLKDFNKTQGTYLFEAVDDYYLGQQKTKRLIYIKTGKPLASLASNQIDMSAVSPEMVTPLKAKGFVVKKDAYGWVRKLLINHKKAPMNNVFFRQALAYAIDQNEMIQKGHRGFASPASAGLVPTTHPLYNPQTPVYSFNPAKARALLEKAGLTKGADGLYMFNGKPFTLTLLGNALSVGGKKGGERDGEILKKQWQAVGLRTQLLALESTTSDHRVMHWDFDVALTGHGGLAGDPAALNDYIRPDVPSHFINSARYGENKELLQLLTQQTEELDPEKRKRLVHQIQTLHARDLPAICLYYPDSYIAYNAGKPIDWFFTHAGLSGKAIPIAQNKMALIKTESVSR